MLTTFAHNHAIDIPLLREATTEDMYNIVGYTTHLNIGDIGQGTAILAEEGVGITRITRLLSDLGTAATYASFVFVNLYVPCGTSQRQAHENFFSVGLPHTHSDLFRPT
jgi:hypothetical protein